MVYLESISITLKGVIEHVIFWSKKDILYFLQRLSHRISLGDFKGLSSVGSGVFTDSIRAYSMDFKVWFISMIYADAKDIIHEFPKPTTDHWKNENEAEIIKSEYNTKDLRDLVKIVRNTAIHRRKNTFPTRSTKELLNFITRLYPDLVMVAQNYMSITHELELASLLDKD
ncbi:putative reverse transcriptase domain-containing protein [Tanacetum coccineum]